jgi:hypothetical protein
MKALGAAVAVGVAVMLLAWYGASDTVVVDDQMQWASVGLTGAMLVAVAGFVAVAIVHQRMRRRFRLVEASLGPCLARMSDTVAGVAMGTSSDGAALVAAANMQHYHRPDCRLAAGKAVRPASRADHEQAGRRICAVCAP